MVANIAEFAGTGGAMRIEPLPDGKHRVSVEPAPGHTVARRTWVTAYPIDLIQEIHSAKDLYVCDEIMREESPRYVEHSLRHEVLSYLEPAEFAGKRILDFGCGSGASVMVLSRLLPPCEIVGIELEEKLLNIARLRARHFGRTSVRLLQSPCGDSLPERLGEFDFVMLSAVFEHLLPAERRQLLPKIWAHLRPGGVLFLNQTPYRYSPVEVHTTGGLPLINYFPDRLALYTARRFCKRVSPTEEWTTLLRRGIRGGTVPEILGILGGPKRAALLKPLPRVGDRIDLWINTLSPKHAWLKRSIWASLKAIKKGTGAEITPDLSLAIRKQA
jgi:2-polyprenyl-3-methyl-5-hydroxy-6-metoxy-1,4-benzoquinol methylase